MRRIGLRLASVWLVAAAAGCGVPQWWFDANQGALFQGLDTVAQPGEPAAVRVSLRGGRLLSGLSDYTVLFYLDGRRIGAAKTDANGLAQIEQTFSEAGLRCIEATLDPAELGRQNVPTCQVCVGVYPPQTPLAIVDLDKTLVADGFDQVLLADPRPMPHSREVLDWLSESTTILYLTHRPEVLARRSRQWLSEHQYPPGPLLVSMTGEFLAGSEAFKTGAIERLRQDFTNLRFGIGDKISDAQAYTANGLQSFLIVQPDDLTGGELRELVGELDALPADVQVVTDWRQVRQAIAGEARFDRPDAQKRLTDLAAEKQAQQEAHP